MQLARLSIRGGRTFNASLKNVGAFRMNAPLAASQSLSRSFSAMPGDSDVPSSVANTVPDLSNSILEAAKLAADEKMVDAAMALTTAAPEKCNFVVRGVMDFIDGLHTLAGIPYWESIVLTTIGLRLLLLPVALKTVQGSARMAQMRPAMQKVQEAMQKDPNAGDMNVKMRYQKEMQALFVKYKVNPLRAVMWPFVQFPVFIAFFMALQNMGGYFPGMATGGALWFTDLTAADSYYILPIINSVTFLAMLEMGSDGVQINQHATFKNVMRGLAVAMVPLTASMPQGLFVYWGTNNILSMIQTTVLKKQKFRDYFDIPAMPAADEAPALKVRNPISAISEMIQKEKSKGDNAKAEILDGVSVPKPPSSTPPPVTFSAPPKKKN